jgi:Tubulin-tyrosine ligase family
MIESPLLLDGRTFSMRVYVVLCGTAATAATKEPDVEPIVYIAKEGLIKLAAVPWREDDPTAAQSSDTTAHTAWNDIDPRMYLTNSGREANMSQTNFAYLRRHVSEAAFVEIWGSIVSAVDTVMTLYHSQIVIANAGSSADTACSMLGLPKIMGFDFVVDQSHQAWLVEVNRFPGLEPRGSTGSSDKGSNDDSLVKRQIVRDAWLVAAATSDGYTHETTMTDVMKWWLEQCGTKDGIWSWLKDDFADLGCLDKNAIMLKKL